MATNYQTPGVYVEEISAFPPSISQVETAIPAFIGYTQLSPDNLVNPADPTQYVIKPTRITSLLDYVTYFGAAQPEQAIAVALTEQTDSGGKTTLLNAAVSFTELSVYNMYYSLQMFFANGGGPCYIVSVGLYDAAVFPGEIADTALLAGLNALEKMDEPTLIIFPEGPNISNAAKYYALQDASLQQCAKLQDRFAIIDLHDVNGATGDIDATAFRGDPVNHIVGIGNDNLNYGAAYYPNLITTLTYIYDESKVTLTHNLNGVANAGLYDGKAMNDASLKNTLYYTKCADAISNYGVTLPPTSTIAGVYASVDNSRGVWKSPANVGLTGLSDLSRTISDADQQTMNIDPTSGKSINAIRAFTGKGFLVWGARTLDGNSNDWRYISVRRLYIMVEESVKKAVMQFVFEPNDANTWTRVRAMIENYLTNLWRQGALTGSKPEQAFYVRVGLGLTMTFDDVLNGKMIIEIGMAPVRPAEFIILQFTQIQQTS
jgi:phage tail sheath protein FI